MALQLTRRQFTASEYHQMAEAGILSEDDRVELIDGEIVEMAPIGSRHMICVNRLTWLFSQRFAGAAIVSIQNPVRLDDRTEPQPDVVLLRPRPDFYAAVGIPRPEDVILLVEVADTTVEADRCVKMPLYARSGIREAWLVDVEQEVITAYREPGPNGYGGSQTVGRGESLAPLAFPDQQIAATDILGEGSGADT